ncbi:MAG: zinc-binding dehydrogenase [Phycisphaerales bacterium]|nr:zinc-binding dehydrogenase [Phycisphaerales bacterium]MCI0630011.1 zinc-binding dehydrogenase [Phycisphaerales bacterium]MCI0675019.1 zinc-binding dehydrogenase [Phycisphaerales bacterium]
MKAAVITKTGSPVGANVKVVTDWPDAKPQAGEVVIRTEAAALNHLDLFVGHGLPGLDLTYPRISGSDGAGIVESVGENVDRSWVGKRILLNAAVKTHERPRPDSMFTPPEIRMIGEHTHGCLAEKFMAPVTNVLEIGQADPVEAVAFGLTHLTAWRMLRTKARVEPGQWVLITGIGGGVALAALNIARHFGCKTIVTSRHQAKLDRAKQLGADHGVLDQGADWSKAVRAITGKRGVDVCIDSAGKAVHLACIKSLARGGIFVTCGATSGGDATTDLTRVFWNQLSIVGSTMGDMNEFREVVALLRSGAIKPVIDSVFDSRDASKAFARLESGEQFGKIVVRWS